MRKYDGIPVRNIYYMLCYAFQALKQLEDEEIDLTEFDNIHDLFAAILSVGIGRQIKQGLYLEYQSFTEDLPTIRGKVNLQGTIRNRLARRQVISCDFDELTENNLLNQILKTTVLFLIRHGDVRSSFKDVLKNELLYFSAVDTIEPAGIPWSSIRFHRNNQSYRLLIGICQLILEGLLESTDSGETRMAAFMDEQRMCRLYEKFILEYYRREWPDLNANPSQIPWALDDAVNDLLPVMQTDITLQCGSSVLIIDAKYYAHTTQTQFDRHTVHSGNLYQIFTYVKNREYAFDDAEHTVSGMLLYARTEEEIQPNQTYSMHGSQISVRTLDLTGPFEEISGTLDQIAEIHFGPSTHPNLT